MGVEQKFHGHSAASIRAGRATAVARMQPDVEGENRLGLGGKRKTAARMVPHPPSAGEVRSRRPAGSPVPQKRRDHADRRTGRLHPTVRGRSEYRTGQRAAEPRGLQRGQTRKVRTAKGKARLPHGASGPWFRHAQARHDGRHAPGQGFRRSGRRSAGHHHRPWHRGGGGIEHGAVLACIPPAAGGKAEGLFFPASCATRRLAFSITVIGLSYVGGGRRGGMAAAGGHDGIGLREPSAVTARCQAQSSGTCVPRTAANQVTTQE